MLVTLLAVSSVSAGLSPALPQNPPSQAIPQSPSQKAKMDRKRAAEAKRRAETELKSTGDRPIVLARTWNYLTTELPRGFGAIVDEERAYLALTSGRMVALQLATGAEVWSIEAGILDQAPVAASGFLFVHLPAAAGSAGSSPSSTLQAYAQADGRRAWARPFGTQIKRVDFLDSAGLLLVACQDGTLAGVRPQDGMVAWTVNLPSASTSAPAGMEKEIWIGTEGGQLCRLELGEGTARLSGSVLLDGAICARPALGTKSGFAATIKGTLYKLDRRPFHVKWSRRLGAAVRTALELADSLILVGCYDNYLYAFSAGDGFPAWRRLIDGRLESDMFRSDRALLVGAQRASRVLGFDPRTGTLLGSLEWPHDSGVSGPLTGTSGILLLPTDEGIYAVSLSEP